MERPYKVLLVKMWFINLKSTVMFDLLLSNSYFESESAIAHFREINV
ncbi:MAG: hypothetical protein F6K39_23455 [Okeania sp. SIO3B3]|nr:hypothetical protein [Okeania sp. SIO3B3]